MRNIKFMLKNNFKDNKMIVLGVIFSVLLIGLVAIPTLSELKNTTPTYTITAWDGTIANSYSDGTGEIDDPYIISNGNELAFLASELENKINYEGKYFIITNDIILNKGVFSYTKNDGIKYTEDNTENIITPSEEIDTINVFKHLNGFKGNIDGQNHTIYGLYIDESLDDGQNALFTNLEGTINNLNIKNSIIYSGKIVAGVASITKNSTLTNISYDGFVVADEEITNETVTLDIENITKTVTENELTDNINIENLNYIKGIITEITLSGTYQTNNNDAVLKINNETISAGEFKLILNNNLQTTIPITYQTNSESNFTLSNLKYEIKYSYSNASGIVSIAENTTLKNIINKANVNASVYASGIVNTVSGLTGVTNAYNTGTIESTNTSSGLISNINQNKENVTITNCYNNGILVSNNNALIGDIENNTGTITLTNIFNTQDNYGINLISSTNVTINNSYIVSDKNIKIGSANGEFIRTTIENLKNKSFIKTNLKYQEYTENIEDNVWVWNYENDSLPILYIDELNKPIANIHIKDNIWNSYKTELNTLKLSEKIVFSIEQVNELNPIKEIYYYISNEKNALTKQQLDEITEWNTYENITQINEEGFYTIYVKIIDYNNNEIYINSDLLIIDLTGADITISTSFTDNTWKEFTEELNNYYIEQEITIDIQAEDSLSGVNKIYYYISDKVLSQEELENIEEWIEYTESVKVNSQKSIIYAKVIDNCGYATYANSDIFNLNGYTLKSLSAGMNGNAGENIYITENSSITLNFTYQDTFEYIEGSKHQIISNVLLPQNTKITLIDRINKKVYRYTTTYSDYGYNDCNQGKCEAKYNFELFTEIGGTTKFQESNYTGNINEDFTITLDFANVQINKNIENIAIYLKLDNENKNEIRNTLSNSMKKFNIISENSDAYFTLTSTFSDTINYNENKRYNIDFKTKLNYKTLEENKIIDTTYEDKFIGLAINLVNSNGDIVSKQNLKNIAFKIGDKKYSPSSDGIVRINLEKGINDIEDNLIIETYSDNYNIEEGNYKFIISLYTAYDGIYSNEILSNIEIPVYVGKNSYNNDNNFNVIMSNEDKIIITKKNEFDFEFLLSETYQNTNIKMSLYKKNSLSAYDQNYTIVDLGKYLTDNSFEKYDENVYYAFKELDNNNKLKLNLDTSLLEKKGYMFVFELYDGEKLVNKISKKFIVK